MSLQVFVAHTGQRLEADPASFSGFEAFRTWLVAQTNIPAPNQIPLSAKGKAFKDHMLRPGEDIFVYDRDLIAATSPKSAKTALPEVPRPPEFNVDDPPDTITNQTDLQAWKELFRTRGTWASRLEDQCLDMLQAIQTRYDEVDIISRSAQVASDNLETHVAALDRRLADAQNWEASLARVNHISPADLAQTFDRLSAVPSSDAMVSFASGRPLEPGGLTNLVVADEINAAAALGRQALESISVGVKDLGLLMDRLVSGLDTVRNRASELVHQPIVERVSEGSQLMEDIKALARKVGADFESVSAYPKSLKSVSQASKAALLHTEKFLPSLARRGREMHDLLCTAIDARNAAASESVDVLQAIGAFNQLCGELSRKLEVLGVSEPEHEALELLETFDRLPVIYASIVAEAIRRHEWANKVRSDSSTLANEMAGFQEEEEKRRQKWQKSLSSSLRLRHGEPKAMGVEVNLHGEEEPWPQATRSELDELLRYIAAHDFAKESVADIKQLVTELDSPTKQQSKRAKSFKNGSIHEASIGRSALLVRGDDDLIRGLQDANIKAESKLKSAESRVRRLEDVLHKQMSKPATPRIGVAVAESHDQAAPVGSPRLLNELSRRPSINSRRYSVSQSGDEKTLANRVLSLEAELIAERERSSGLQLEIDAKANSTLEARRLMEDAVSTKRDLLRNLEAQRQEFGRERASYVSEVEDLKVRIEAYEDDMERILGSRENRKAGVDEQVREMQVEVDRVVAEASAESQKAQGQVDYLRNDAKLQRELSEVLSRDLQRARDENRELRTRTTAAEESVESQLYVLHELYALLVPASDTPTEAEALTEALLSNARDFANEIGIRRDELRMAHSGREAAEVLATQQKAEVVKLAKRLEEEELQSQQLREKLSSESARLHSLESALNDKQQELAQLRAKFAAGETGSEALRSRVEDEERKVATMSSELASRNSKVGSLEEELLSVNERLQGSHMRVDDLTARLDGHTARSKEITRRLYAQNDRLWRLLERMGYVIVRDGPAMVIQRAPKADRGSSNETSDPASSLRRDASVSAIRSLADSGDLEHLYWMQAATPEAEREKYEAFLSTIGALDIEAICETVLRRVKDIEHAARKSTRDARSYRERYQRAQGEAHEKIAYKNFKEGDLALFLPTRNLASGAWAAFNVGAPHYLLHEQESHKLRSREWLLARIHKIDERVVDVAKSIGAQADGRSIGSASVGDDSLDDENPFDLADGLRWYLLEAAEEKPGAPTTPGLGKTTVASTSVDATGTIRRAKRGAGRVGAAGDGDEVSKTLSRSLDSRRGSTIGKALPFSKSPSLREAPGALEGRGDGAVDIPRKDAAELARAGTSLSPGRAGVGRASPGRSLTKVWDSLWALDVSVERG